MDAGRSSTGLRRWQGLAVRIVLVAAVVVLVAIVRPSQVRTTLTSPSALLRIAALVLAITAWSLLVRRFVHRPPLRLALVALPLVAVLVLVIVPSFRTTRVDEALPTTTAELLGQPPAAPAPTVPTAPTAPTAPGSVPAGAPAVPAPSAPASVPAAPATAAPAGPVAVTTGTLRGIGHRASGSARILRLPDGAAFVRLDEISIESGPDYFVHLVPGADRRRPDGGTDLGRLKAVSGSQSYAVPAGTDISGEQTVLVWCRAFAVPVAAATQRPA